MTGDAEWGPVIEHDGKPRPELMGVWAKVETANGQKGVGIIRNSAPPPPGKRSRWIWATLPDSHYGLRIIRYRLRRPAALQDLIRLAANPAPQRDLMPA